MLEEEQPTPPENTNLPISSRVLPQSNISQESELQDNVTSERQTVNTNARGVVEVGRFPIADMLNEWKTAHFLALAYPWLFPYGIGSLDQQRDHEVKPARYYQHLINYFDRRFAQCPEFVFFALNSTQRRQVNSALSCGIRKSNAFSDEVTLDSLYKLTEHLHNDNPTEEEQTSVNQQLHSIMARLTPFTKGLRGTYSYMKGARNKLNAMLRGGKSLPVSVPTWFLTLSAADVQWPEVFKAINPTLSDDEILNIPVYERMRMIVDNPNIVSTIYWHRWKAFWKYIINGSRKPLGKIIDWFFR